MLYREQLLYFLDRDEDLSAMMDWIEEHPELDQPDILRELRDILIERNEKTGEKDWIEIADQLGELIDKLEDEILDEKLHKALFFMQFQDVEFDPKQVELLITTVREAVIKSILSNPKNNEEMWELAQKVIKAEKSSGLYDPANWIAIL